MPHLLIIDAPYYEHISKGLRAGAEAVLKANKATWEYQAVPGVLEIPAALSMVLSAQVAQEMMAMEMEESGMPPGFTGGAYDGFVLLGCVIRGETAHFDIVAFESARAIMDLTTEYALALGNGIQTTENEAQALARADPAQLDKGGHAAQAALDMIALRDKLSV
ncbi:6,7-dimethyl-8-ribityllumazine synthase [Pseudahrensia aquimaris]|uniref:6,7-dimethyl-8-ribityllumazine synthase n=1 Tax=Pseudahrensia aquimaris TaxID=744461 RepID=A0ABW3FCR6_9HYPH